MARRSVLASLLCLGAAWPGGGSLPTPPGEGCQRNCGGVHIPFPFGYGPSHCMLPGFEIACNKSSGKDGDFFKPSLESNEITSISLSSGQMTLLNRISYYCYDPKSQKMMASEWWWNMDRTPYIFSHTANKFTVMGCRAMAYIGDAKSTDVAAFTTGCVAMCRLNDLADVSCSGIGCCKADIPKGLKFYQVWFDPHLSNWTGPCSYAVLSSNVTFSTTYLTSDWSHIQDLLVPVVLDWAIGQEGCEVARKKPGFACLSSNHRCAEAAGGRGYICKCEDGFQGNPYIHDGCQGESAAHILFVMNLNYQINNTKKVYPMRTKFV